MIGLSYERILQLADCLEKRGSLSVGESYYWQGYPTTACLRT